MTKRDPRASFATGLGVLACSLAGLNAAVASAASVIDTCTGGSSDSLFGGALLSAPLYLLSSGLLLWKRPGRAGWLFLIPAIILTLDAGQHAALMFYTYVFQHGSLCDISLYGPYERNSEDPFVLSLWVGMTLLMVGSLMWIAWSSIRRKPTS